MSSLSSSPPRGGAGGAGAAATMIPREASPPFSSSSFSAAAFQPPWALEAGRGSLSAAELAVVALGRLFFLCYSTLRFLLVSLRVLPGPGGKNLRASVARLGGMPPRTELAREAAERVVARVLNRPPPQRPAVILCFGDSLTEGTLGADWVARLADSLAGTFGGSSSGASGPGPGPGVVVVNAGVSGQLAAAVAARVERCVAACSGRVVGVMVMAGTNDVLAACAGKGRKGKKGRRKGSNEKAGGSSSERFDSFLGSLVRLCYRAANALPRAPLTRPAALAAVAAALDAAALAAPGAALAVATVPPLGSGDPTSRVNAAVRDLNRGIRCVASARPRVSLLDVHAALSAAMMATNSNNSAGGGGEEEEDSDSEEEEDIAFSVGPSCLASALLRVLFRVSWDTAARWKAYSAAAAAAATGLPQRLLLLSGPSSLFLGFLWRKKSPTASAPAPTEQKRRRKAKRSLFSSSSSNSLLHDGVHFGETAAACVLALALPWARRAARGAAGCRGVGSASASSAAAVALPRNSSNGSAGLPASATGLATALSLAASPPSPSRRRGAVVAASTSKAVGVGNGSSSGNGGGKGVSGALASAISLFASGR